jgi:predicted nuclease of predicted toxin-antitoxin system
MKFKIDENLPGEIAEMLRSALHEASTVADQGLVGAADQRVAETCAREGRILVTLDLDFADVGTYSPRQYPGFIVLRVYRQDRNHVLATFRRVLALLPHEASMHRLWIVEEDRIRIRREEEG